MNSTGALLFTSLSQPTYLPLYIDSTFFCSTEIASGKARLALLTSGEQLLVAKRVALTGEGTLDLIHGGSQHTIARADDWHAKQLASL